MELHITNELAGQLQRFIEASVGNDAEEVIQKAFVALEHDLFSSNTVERGDFLVRRFRKYQGALENTTLKELLEFRREGLS